MAGLAKKMGALNYPIYLMILFRIKSYSFLATFWIDLSASKDEIKDKSRDPRPRLFLFTPAVALARAGSNGWKI